MSISKQKISIKGPIKNSFRKKKLEHIASAIEVPIQFVSGYVIDTITDRTSILLPPKTKLKKIVW